MATDSLTSSYGMLRYLVLLEPGCSVTALRDPIWWKARVLVPRLGPLETAASTSSLREHLLLAPRATCENPPNLLERPHEEV